MEFFNKAKAVRLRSHLGKYLVADDDGETVRQSRNGSSQKARWTAEFVEGRSHVVRLKSCHGRQLTASDDSFLLGMTGKKVIQTTVQKTGDNLSAEWEPIKERGYHVKLRSIGGKFLRANGGTPPWRNSVTHDVPHRTATKDWVLWEVEVLNVPLLDTPVASCDSPSYISPASSFSSLPDDFRSSNAHSLSISSNKSAYASGRKQKGMKLFDKARAVRLQSHFGKYLVADDDEETVRQNRNGSSPKARWTVEFVQGGNTIRLKSYHGMYLTASDEPFLLGMTGKRVVQSLPETKAALESAAIEWEPVTEGGSSLVKLQTREGKFLRANGGTPPWRNSITHDVPHRTATQDWVLWGVDVVDITLSTETESISSNLSTASSFSSLTDDFMGSPETGSPSVVSRRSAHVSLRQESLSLFKRGMEFFQKAKTIRLRSHHDKYLHADDDKESVYQDRYGTHKNARWTVEIALEVNNVVRLRSCYDRYLTATDEQYLLGVTGRKVLQSMPKKLDSSVEFEPIREGMQVRLKTRYGNYLRANGGLPPWRNSITHDIPHRHNDWILWEVDVLEAKPDPPMKVDPPREPVIDLSSSSFRLVSSDMTKIESFDSFGGSPKGRVIYYNVMDDNGNVDDGVEGPSFQFLGHGLEELTEKLEEATGLENIIVCSCNKFNGKLYPLRLALPPNNATMRVVVVPATSRVAREFLPGTP